MIEVENLHLDPSVPLASVKEFNLGKGHRKENSSDALHEAFVCRR